jgi:hypothetical protein
MLATAGAIVASPLGVESAEAERLHSREEGALPPNRPEPVGVIEKERRRREQLRERDEPDPAAESAARLAERFKPTNWKGKPDDDDRR